MDPLLVGLVALLLGGAIGVAVGRASGRSAALLAGAEDGRRSGIEQGRRSGREEGRLEGFEEGRREGPQEGRNAGLEQGRRAGRDEEQERSRERFEALVAAVARGRMPEGLAEGSPEAELRDALVTGWAPREAERQAALREAIGRVASFLQAQVREPLAGVEEGADAEELRERIGRALGSLEDLDFFMSETEEERRGTDLAKLAQEVSRQFAADQDIGVRLMLGNATVRASVNAPALMDALYLILHNAGRFGGGSTVDLTVESAGGRATIRVRDRGEGFTEEAFARAFDPFYSTSNEGLGLGLPHARKVVEGMGGEIHLHNVPDGGAEVEVSFPAG